MTNLKKTLAVLLAALILASTVAFASTSLVTTGNCYLRTGPGLYYSAIDTIPSGTSITATASRTDERGVKWYKVKYYGDTGWVSSVYAKKNHTTKKVVIATGDTYIRTKGNRDAKKLGVLYTGERATYLNKSTLDSRGVRWYKISYCGLTGWVSSVNSYVK